MASGSSGSGSGSGSGSLSSQSMPSSMESGSTLPNQDVTDGYFSEPEETDHGWGKLIPLGKAFELIGWCIQYVRLVSAFLQPLTIGLLRELLHQRIETSC